MIDRFKERQEIGAATKRIEAAERAYLDERKARRDGLHETWRRLADEAEKARKAYDAALNGWEKASDPNDRKIIADAKRKHPDLLLHDQAPGQPPRLCAATGLALFDDDEVYGDSEYGAAILRAAVSITVATENDEAGA